MTYEQYIKETTVNCMKVLTDCSSGELSDLEHLRRILWEDDRVTGVISGFCTSMNGIAEDNIKDILFDEKFLEDFNETGMDMQKVMASGPDAIDIAARCLALRHVSVLELAEQEQEKRIENVRQSRNTIVKR